MRREAEEKSRRRQLRDELEASKAATEEADMAARKVKQKLKKAKAKARAKSEKSDSESSSSSDTESGADERSEEAKAIERLKADGNADYEEQALDVLWSTFVIQKLVNDVGGVDKTTPRTLKELIQWKRKTLDTEFKNLARMVKQGGAELRKTIIELYQRLMRTEQLGVCVAAAVVTQLLAEADQSMGELVHDTATGMCRTDPIDWEEFKEQRKNRPVSSRLLNSEDPLEDEPGFWGLHVVVREKNGKDAGQAWSMLMGAVTSTLCKERNRADSRFEALREFLVLKDGKINAEHEICS
jgi:hypothetical protein